MMKYTTHRLLGLGLGILLIAAILTPHTFASSPNQASFRDELVATDQPTPQAQTTNEAIIDRFSSSTLQLNQSDLTNGTAQVMVNWQVSNRPDDTNLVFEQIMPDGTSRNAELPREFVIIPSDGSGPLAPIMPTEQSLMIVFQLRLVNLTTDTTLTNAQIAIPIMFDQDDAQQSQEIYTGDDCYDAPFPPDQEFQINNEIRIQTIYNGNLVYIYREADNSSENIAQAAAGTTLTVVDGPYCIQDSISDFSVTHRHWQVEGNHFTGWIDEYAETFYGFAYFVQPTDKDDLPIVEITSFDVSPTTIADFNGGSLTVSWDTSNAVNVDISIQGLNRSAFFDLESSGSFTLNLSDYELLSNPLIVSIYAEDTQINSATQQSSVNIDTRVRINNFSATPTTVAGNEQVTFSWDITGDFIRAFVHGSTSAPSPVNFNIDTNQGTQTVTMPDNIIGERIIYLTVVDTNDVQYTDTITLNLTCAYGWEMAVSPDVCPSSGLIANQGAYQEFEGGFMIWLPARPPSMWVFFDNGTFARYDDTWDNTPFTIDDTPESGLFAPERGFGYLWNTNPTVQSNLGWATGLEQGYTINAQSTLSQSSYDRSTYYLTLPNGQIIRAVLQGRTVDQTPYWDIVN